jgi:pimeloyl-ACP methyl ester carboxylesterase
VIVSRVARCSSSWTISVLVLALAGCGGTWQATFEAHGLGKNQYWTLRAKGNPKAVVVLLHGLGQDSGEQLEPWQAHLAQRGYDVIYPRYEDPPPAADARDNIVGAVRRGLGELGRPKVPLVLLGHSRGGRLAVEAAAFLQPKLVLAFYPGQINPSFEPPTNFKLLPQTTNVWLFVGDKDTSVGNHGAIELAERLLSFGFPAKRIHAVVIHSKGFTADHMSVYDLSPAAKRGIWDRADRLIDEAIAA